MTIFSLVILIGGSILLVRRRKGDAGTVIGILIGLLALAFLMGSLASEHLLKEEVPYVVSVDTLEVIQYTIEWSDK